MLKRKVQPVKLFEVQDHTVSHMLAVSTAADAATVMSIVQVPAEMRVLRSVLRTQPAPAGVVVEGVPVVEDVLSGLDEVVRGR